jgi:hypothetical protein
MGLAPAISERNSASATRLARNDGRTAMTDDWFRNDNRNAGIARRFDEKLALEARPEQRIVVSGPLDELWDEIGSIP